MRTATCPASRAKALPCPAKQIACTALPPSRELTSGTRPWPSVAAAAAAAPPGCGAALSRACTASTDLLQRQAAAARCSASSS